MRKKTSTLSAVAVAALLLAGCSAGGDNSSEGVDGEIKGEITFQTWALTPKFNDYLSSVISGFEEQYPGTTVNLQDQPGDGYQEKLVSQATTDSLPDVVNTSPGMGVALAKSGALLDLSTAVDNLDDTYLPEALATYRYTGLDGTYGMPWYLNTEISYWNATQMRAAGLDPEKPPTTIDELFSQAKTMTENSGGKNFLLSAKPTVDDFARAGIPILNEDKTEAAFNTEEGRNILQRYVDAYREGLFPQAVLNTDYLGNSAMFTQGQVAFSTGGGPAYASFVRDNPSLEGNIVMSSAINDTPPLFVQGLSVSANSKNKATAVAFANYILNPENQLEFAKLTSTFPSTKATANDPSLSQDDGTPAGRARVLASESLQKAKVLTPVEFDDAMKKIFDQQTALAMRGDVSAQQALDDAAAQIDRLLSTQ